MSDKHHNIFISHYGRDDDKVQRLKARLREKGYNVRNFSIDSTKHKDGRIPKVEVIKRTLRMHISRSKTFIVLIGKDTHKRKWVNEEIKMAKKQGKQIIGIYAHGEMGANLPEELEKTNANVIGWNSLDKLGDILDGKNVDVERPDGSPRPNKHTPDYPKC